MRRLLIILPLITFTAITLAPDSVFAASCPAGQYGASITAPSSSADTYGYYSHDGIYKRNYTSPALSAGQWSATWDSIGIAKGIASCNGTSGRNGTTTNSSDSFTNTANGEYCWCKMTEWTPNGGTTQSLAGAWVFFPGSSASSCARTCAYYCAGRVVSDSGSRSAVFGAVGACNLCPDASGFYTGASGTNAPTAANGGITSDGGNAITSCYAPSGTTYHDAMGTFTFSSNCAYTN